MPGGLLAIVLLNVAPRPHGHTAVVHSNARRAHTQMDTDFDAKAPVVYADLRTEVLIKHRRIHPLTVRGNYPHGIRRRARFRKGAYHACPRNDTDAAVPPPCGAGLKNRWGVARNTSSRGWDPQARSAPSASPHWSGWRVGCARGNGTTRWPRWRRRLWRWRRRSARMSARTDS